MYSELFLEGGSEVHKCAKGPLNKSKYLPNIFALYAKQDNPIRTEPVRTCKLHWIVNHTTIMPKSSETNSGH